MKAHIGADVESGLVHLVHGTAANVADMPQVAELLHGDENAVYVDAGYTGVEKREEHESRNVIWQIAARRSPIPCSISAACSTRTSAGSSIAKLRRVPRSSILFA